MKDQRLEIKDIVKHIDHATLGRLDIPEFQRRFVWTPEKVKKFVDSLWHGYPVGALLLWDSAYSSPKTALAPPGNKLWVVDGQQRVTSLSLVFGKKPFWWDDAEDWNRSYKKYDVLVNLKCPADALEFGLPNPVRKKSPEWISVRNVLHSDSLSKLAQEVSDNLKDQDFALIHEKLQSVKKIEGFPVFEIIIDHELEDVAEIFSRLNTAGTKIKESDVVIALVAAKQVGWIREEFDPFLKGLGDKGFDLEPSVLIRALAAIGKGSARLKDIPGAFWEPSKEFSAAWKICKESIGNVQRCLAQEGVLSSDILPAHNALIPLFVLWAKFPKQFDFKRGLHWFLLATRDGRYSGSAITTLDSDFKRVKQAASFEDALLALEDELRVPLEFTPEDFSKDYGDDFLRLILYLIVFKARARDWENQEVRIGYDRKDNKLNDGFKPEWHHFFPKKILRGKVDDTGINSLANIAVLNEKANKAFSSKPPKNYLEQYEVKAQRLREQFIPDEEALWDVANYGKFCEIRSAHLAEAATSFFDELRGG